MKNFRMMRAEEMKECPFLETKEGWIQDDKNQWKKWYDHSCQVSEGCLKDTWTKQYCCGAFSNCYEYIAGEWLLVADLNQKTFDEEDSYKVIIKD